MMVKPGLIPVENWYYSFYDALASLPAAFSPPAATISLQPFGFEDCIPVESGRTGIVLALRALNLKPGATVGVPLYTCPVVLRAIASAGMKPCFIDIDPETYCVAVDDFIAKRSQFDAAIVIHMFGNPCDMPRLIDAAEGKPVIEDCAQAFGSILQGRTTGSFGTIAVFSFRSGKYFSVGEGGALFCPDGKLREKIAALAAALPLQRKSDEVSHIVKTLLRTVLRRRPLWGIFGSELWSRYNINVRTGGNQPFNITQAFKTDIHLAVYRLQSVEAAIEVQRKYADYYLQSLVLDKEMLCPEQRDTKINRYLFPILLPSVGIRDTVAQSLLLYGIGTIKPYQNIVETAAEQYGYTGGCPVTEDLSKRLLVIPVHHGLKMNEVKRIAYCVNSSWKTAFRSESL